MDLGIAGKTALVCASSRGLGRACAFSLARNGVNLVLNARGAETLEACAAEIRAQTGADVRTVAADITSSEGREKVLADLPPVDILVNNAGGPPPGDFHDWGEDAWLSALRANMLTPIELIKALIDGMASRGFGRIINITSSAVKAPIPELGLSNGARSGLTGFVAGLARAYASSGVTVNALLPGRFLTDRLLGNFRKAAEASGKSLEEVQAESLRQIPARRFGDPEEFGEFCAFLASRQAGYLTGQNILVDGGTYPGTF